MIQKFNILCLFILCGNISTSFGMQEKEILYDFEKEWLVYEEGKYTPFTENDNGKTRGVYFWVNLVTFKDSHLNIESGSFFSVFINGALIQSGIKAINLNTDSLRRAGYQANLFISVRQEKIHTSNLTTTIHAKNTKLPTIAGVEQMGKPATFFRDFVVVGILILLIFLTVIIRLNSKQAADYFSVTKIFSQRESDDSQPMKISSSSNILFYLFFSMLASFLLLIVFHFLPGTFAIGWAFKTSSFGGALLGWLKLIIIVLSLTFAKILIVFFASRLFGLQEIFGLHITNWIRVMVITLGILLIVAVALFISRNISDNFYVSMLGIVVAMLILGILILIPKLMRRAGFSLFHIFSYICATEIIPLLITIKIIYN